MCCGKCRVQTKDDPRFVTLCVNACVGVSQLFTVTFLLVGWFWSIAWGVNMVLLSGMINLHNIATEISTDPYRIRITGACEKSKIHRF